MWQTSEVSLSNRITEKAISPESEVHLFAFCFQVDWNGDQSFDLSIVVDAAVRSWEYNDVIGQNGRPNLLHVGTSG